MSWFGGKSDDHVQNFYPVTSYQTGFGALTEADTSWACSTHRGFQTETQVWYSILEDGSLLLVQVIWSYVGVFLIPATAQMTFKHYNPKTKKSIWRSINVGGFKTHGRGCKSDAFEITHTGTPDGEEVYDVSAVLDKTVSVTVTFTKPADAPGFKLGDGPQGGISTFGKEKEDGKRDGFVVHRFHPMVKSAGSVILEGQVVDAVGEATFIHAIQGMRPDSIASRWNFAFFTSGGGNEDGPLGSVRAIQMELETTDSYGPKGPKSGRTKVNIGAIYSSSSATKPLLVNIDANLPSPSDTNPLLVVGQTHSATPDAYPSLSNDVSSATHLTTARDSDTGYAAPTAIEFKWEGERRDGKGKMDARVRVDKLGMTVAEGGLMEKVDVLAEIPYVIRKGLAAVTGTKPIIYQYLNPATLQVNSGDGPMEVKGWIFNEASFVSQ